VALKYFLDTNIPLYASSARPEDEGKRLISLQILGDGGFATSAQVHQEFYHIATRKNEPKMEHSEAIGWLDDLAAFEVIPITRQLVVAGAGYADRYQLSYWDGAIIAAAHLAGVDTVLSEDLNNGQLYGSVRVINPFAGYKPKDA
jgi:predicted nucleic acid-binding protein